MSGSAAAISSQLRCSDGSPANPRTSSPPAYSISCGVQWPAAYGGSSHSSAATRGRLAPRTGEPDPVDPRRGLSDQVDRLVLGVGRLRQRPGIAEHLADRPRVQRDHDRLAVDLLGDRTDLVVGDRADPAQRLGDDQLGLQLVQQVGVERVQSCAGQRPLLDRGVDLGRGQVLRQRVAA